MDLKNKKILITCGPTWVPIDDMRVISNRSTGRLAQLAAKKLAAKKAQVTVLEGPVLEPLKPRSRIKIVKFTFYDELSRLMQRELKRGYDIVIHAAAVSDYQMRRPFKKKIESKNHAFTLDLIRTKKIIAQIKKTAPDSFLVGFKLATRFSPTTIKTAVKGLFKKCRCDLVIANTIQKRRYSGQILNKDFQTLAKADGRESMVGKLVTVLTKAG